jgi:ubiquinone/menaquinone biosynthesis C-methylase UbiE
MDVSPTSLQEARERIALHGKDVTFVLINENDDRLPLEDKSVDIIHSSGVIHHTPDPLKILKEFRRVLKPHGFAQIMVYNYDSLFMHLYTAFIKQIEQQILPELNKRKAFSKFTDGHYCPISECYTAEEFKAIAEKAQMDCTFTGAAISSFEMSILDRRFDAILNSDLNDESRDFLLSLEFDKKGRPLYRGQVAGVDGCFILKNRAESSSP